MNCSGYSINIMPPFYTQLVYGQQFYFTPTIVAFCCCILAAMLSNWMQTIIVLLQQYSAGSIMACIRVYNKLQFTILQSQDRRIAQKFTQLVKCAILISTPILRLLRAGKISKQSGNISIVMFILRIAIGQA